MKVYISGPMTGYPEYNFPAFHAAANAVRELGHEPINPADGVTDTGKPWEWYMRRAIRMLTECDCVVTLDSWENSREAVLEVQLAIQLGMPVYESLAEFINGRG